MEDIIRLRLALLHLVAKGQGKWGWHTLATKLPFLGVSDGGSMMRVLRQLEMESLVKYTQIPDSSQGPWEITDAGKDVLEKDNPFEDC